MKITLEELRAQYPLIQLELNTDDILIDLLGAADRLRHSHRRTARLSDFVSREDCAADRLVPVLPDETRELRLPVHAVYYRNTTLSSRIGCFLDFLRTEIDRRQLL